jgi:hypothetical protein
MMIRMEKDLVYTVEQRGYCRKSAALLTPKDRTAVSFVTWAIL